MANWLVKGLWEFVSDWRNIGRLRNTWPFKKRRTYRVLASFEHYRTKFTAGEILDCVGVRDVPYDSMTVVDFLDASGKSRELWMDFEMSNQELGRLVEKNFVRLPSKANPWSVV